MPPKIRKRIQPSANPQAQPAPAQPEITPAAPAPTDLQPPAPPAGIPTDSEAAPAPVRVRKRKTPSASSSENLINKSPNGPDIQISFDDDVLIKNANQTKSNVTNDLSFFESMDRDASLDINKINIAKMTPTEIIMITSSSKVKVLRSQVEEQMSKREEEFLKNFKPEHFRARRGDAEGIGEMGSSFASNMLNFAKNIHAQSSNVGAFFKDIDYDKYQLPDVPDLPGMEKEGITGIFNRDTESLLAEITDSETSSTSLEKMKEELGVNFLPADIPDIDPLPDFAKPIQDMFDQCKETRVTGPVLDLTRRDTEALILTLTQVVICGSRMPFAKLFPHIAQQMERVARMNPSLLKLKELIESSLASLPKNVVPLHGAILTVLNLAENSMLSPLVRFIAASPTLDRMYFNDAPLMSYGMALRIADVIEAIEQCRFLGQLKLSNITRVVPVSAVRLVSRMHGAATEYITAVRRANMSNQNAQYITSPIDETVGLFVQVLLAQTDGGRLKPEVVWDLVEAAAALSISHFAFPAFKEIVTTENRIATAVTKLSNVLSQCLSAGLAPYILLFMHAASRNVRGLQNPAVLGSTAAVIRVSFELLRLRTISFGFTPSKLKALLDSE